MKCMDCAKESSWIDGGFKSFMQHALKAYGRYISTGMVSHYCEWCNVPIPLRNGLQQTGQAQKSALEMLGFYQEKSFGHRWMMMDTDGKIAFH